MARVPSVRETATFEAYHWEAYNEIVRPDRFDWYLITRWLPGLGTEGFTLLKVLRNLCYFNPKEGTLRDTCQITVDELAQMCGMTRSTVYRVLERNEALRAFVQRLPEAVFVQGQTRRLPPRWRICMDCPIHPDDEEQYDLLRAGREVKRVLDEEEKRKSQIETYEKRKSQRGISDGRKSQIEERKSQNQDRKSHGGILYNDFSLPSVSIPPDSIPSVDPCQLRREVAVPRINAPPQGEGREIPRDTPSDPHIDLWEQALIVLAEQVNKPTLETHLRTVRVVSVPPCVLAASSRAGGVDRTVRGDETVTLSIASAFSLEWLDKRHKPAIEAALSQVLGIPIQVRFQLKGK